MKAKPRKGMKLHKQVALGKKPSEFEGAIKKAFKVKK